MAHRFNLLAHSGRRARRWVLQRSRVCEVCGHRTMVSGSRCGNRCRKVHTICPSCAELLEVEAYAMAQAAKAADQRDRMLRQVAALMSPTSNLSH